MGRGAGQEADGRQRQGQSRRALPADGDHADDLPSVPEEEGDTLVVETTGFLDDGWLDVRGSPFTSAGRLIERFRRPNYGSLVIEVTIDDPKAYTKPFTATVNNRLLPDQQLIEFVCIEKSAHRYVGSDGKTEAQRKAEQETAK